MATRAFHPRWHRSTGRHHRPLLVLAIAISLSLPALLAPATPARAAFPGANGLIAWQRDDQIFTMAPDGTGRTQLTTFEANHPSWSPDGRKIVFHGRGVQGYQISTMDADGGDQMLITDGVDPVWSSDGSTIAFDTQNIFGYQNIFAVDADGSDERFLTEFAATSRAPAWQPHGSWIVFESNRDGNFEIYAIKADGTGLTNLTRTPTADEGAPEWSPDGTRIVYRRGVDVYVMRADGSSAKKIASNLSPSGMSWSPSGSQIVLSSAMEGNTELFRMNADGSGLTQLTKDDGAWEEDVDLAPDWQPAPVAVSTSALAFGGIVIGKSSPRTVTISAGVDPVAIGAPTIDGADNGEFGVASDTCSPSIVPALGSCSIVVRFTPTSVGAKAATLHLDGPAPVDAYEISLSGTGRLFDWATSTTAGPKYTWNEGNALARTTKGSKTYLHAIYTTDRIGSKWANDKGVHAGVYYVRTTNDGAKWTTAKRLNSSKQHGSRAVMASSGAGVYAVWVSTTKWVKYKGTAPRVLYFRRNTNHGASTSWSSTLRLTSKSGRVDFPTIAVTGTYVYVAYTDSVTGTIKLAISADRGKTWRRATLGSTTLSGSSGKSGYPAVAAAGQYVGVSWVDSASGTQSVRTSSDRGSTWDPATSLGATGSTPAAAAHDSRLAFTWMEGGTKVKVWNAGTWGDAMTLPPTDGYEVDIQQIPAVALTGSDAIAVVYSACVQDCDFSSDAGSTIRDLIWRASVDGGATWLASDVVYRRSDARRLNDTASVVWPSVGRVYVLWNGWRENSPNYRLYLRVGK